MNYVIKSYDSYDCILFPSVHLDFYVTKNYLDNYLDVYIDLVTELKSGTLFNV